MAIRTLLVVAILNIAAGCATDTTRSAADQAAPRMRQAGDDYVRCLTNEADRNARSPVGAEEIVAAAHARCWTLWQRYRDATRDGFMADAATPQEAQLAGDKADAHLRQFEAESRRGAVNRIVQRALSKTQP